MIEIGSPWLQVILMNQERVRIAVSNDYEIVVAGLEALLRRYEDRLHVCERIIVGEPVSRPVDVALYDLYGRAGVGASALRTLAGDPNVGRVVVIRAHPSRADCPRPITAGGR